jgi:biotin carboxyl carrier protein
MYKVLSKSIENHISITADGLTINDKNIQWDCVKISPYEYSIIADAKVYNVFVEHIDRAKKIITLNINGQLVENVIQEPIDQILKNMGIDFSKSQKKDPIKAPMPGLVLKVMATVGQIFKKGDPVLVLEAMKMENIFKSPTDATVKEIHVNAGQTVEKGQVLITLE